MNTITATLQAALALVLALGLPGCGDHGHDHGPAKAQGHGHADHGPAGEKLTHFTERTELFVEFPRLVAGESSAFAAHLTRLTDFKALSAAKVTVVLSGGGHPDETFATDTATQPGIFRPQATPKQVGERELAIEVATSEFTVRHVLGPVTVYADRKSADAAPAEVADTSEIGFTKEQQWKVDFALTEAAPREIREATAAVGRIRARPDGEALVTAQVAGQVQPAGSFPHPGQAIERGAVLAYLVPRLGGDSDVATLQAAARKSKLELDQALRERGRLEGLLRDEAIPERRVLAARVAEETARVDHEASQRRLAQYGGAGGGVPIRAPVAGTIADVHVVAGAFAQEGQTLFHIADRRVLWLELRVSESDAARVSAPSGAAFRIEGVDAAFEVIAGKNGRLIASGMVIDPTTRTLPVIFELPKPDTRLRIGMAVKGQVFAGAVRQAIGIPAEAVIDDNGVAIVYVQTGGESFQRRPVRVGVRAGDWVEIVDGLTAGQRVVSRGAYLVKLAAANTGAIGHGHAH